ncbi:MAG: phosphoribosylformylglycinamidine synthase subunit PurS [Nitrospirota bacterium]|jgi:phosphoribosylformylglycinamidine synthase PurS subunit|nr:phosphoribosylformylglycinamidine synthase subunit PurS [Nitrospirota bacterium]MDX2419992.1 phosphoribosylformylglycinamidine synthase subunit PurS [Nitrospirota bacterium]
MKAKIYVTLKDGIHDPQGRAVQQSLHMLGFDGVQDVRMGKFLEVDLQATEKESAEIQIKSMCQKLLANMVIEDFRYELIDP